MPKATPNSISMASRENARSDHRRCPRPRQNPNHERTIYHNPRCSKSRQALQLLRDKGIDPEIVEYLRTPPTREQLVRILDLLGLEPRQLMRTKQAEYGENGLDDPSLSRDELIDAMLAHPIVIERPIVVSGERAALGRPPEKILEVV